MKQLYKLLLPAAIAALLAAPPASAYDFMADGLAYNINPDGTTVTVTYELDPYEVDTTYTNASGPLNIPSSVDYNGKSYMVNAIGDFAFLYCSGFTGTPTIPESVTTIGYCAFYGCNGLNGSLTIPNSVTSIGQYAFYECSGLNGSLSISNSVTSIDACAFSGCSGFTGTLTIPNSVTSIGQSAFSGCIGFTGTLTIPNSVTTIGGGAFCDCGFTSVTIPNYVTTIGNNAFACAGLNTIDVMITDYFAICTMSDIFGAVSAYYVPVDRTTCQLRVPASSLPFYQAFKPWNEFTHLSVLEDVVGDDAVDVDDMNAVINVMVKKASNEQLMTLSDVNRDSVVDVDDLNSIINAMLRRTDTVPGSNPQVTLNIAGNYDTDMYASKYLGKLYYGIKDWYPFADYATHYGNTNQCEGITFEQVAPGVFYCNDLFGGWYWQIRNYGPNYAMTGFVSVDNDGNIKLLHSFTPDWGDGLDYLENGKYDKTTGTISYNLSYAEQIFMKIVLRKSH